MESDRVFRLARVLAHAVEVFESVERARDWLETENRALDGQRPLAFLDTDVGAREVDDVLGRCSPVEDHAPRRHSRAKRP